MPTGMPSKAQGAARLVACCCVIGGFAAIFQIQESEGHDCRFERVDAFDAALEVRARRIAAVGEAATASWKPDIRRVAGS
jgi:hypothetical protein